MKLSCIIKAITTIFLVFIFNVSSGYAQDTSIPKNILFIMLDDADFSDFSYNNHLLDTPDAITPNIEILRNNGRLFTNFHSASAICTPTRISVLTGNHPLRYGAIDAWKTSPDSINLLQNTSALNGIPNSVPQIGKLMQAAGKVTGHFGKWHVGSSRKMFLHKAMGYDSYARYVEIPDPFTSWEGQFKFETETERYVKNVDYVDQEFSLHLQNFIKINAQNPNGFYANFWPLTPHSPWAAPGNFDNSQTNFDLSTRRGQLLAMMFTLDVEIGKIIDVLKDENIFDNTLIIITSDNGGQASADHANPYLKGNKGNLLEGGVRVSAIAHWPQKIPANTSNTSLINTYDLLPTFLDLIEHNDFATVENIVDGKSKKAALISNAIIEHPETFWEISGGPTQKENQKSFAIREREFKLIKIEGRNENNAFENPFILNNLENDPRGVINLARANPDIVEELSEKLRQSRKTFSQVTEIIPSDINTPIQVAFDPRLDVSSKDTTVHFQIDIPDSTISATRLFYKPGTSILYVMPDKSIRWRVIGSDIDNSPITTVLKSPPLATGTHSITMSIGGFKHDKSTIQLYIDDILVDDVDSQPNNVEFLSLWSTISDLRIGNTNMPMTNVKYFMQKFTPADL